MSLFPRRRWFVIVTYLHSFKATDHRTPRQLRDHFALSCKRVKLDLMVCRPVVFLRSLKQRLLISNIRMLERKLADAELTQRVDVAPHVLDVGDEIACH